MTFFWVERPDGERGTVEAETPEQATVHGDVLGTLPYPAGPVFYQLSDCPAFCHQPEKCLNRGACPRNRACDD